MDSLGTRIKKSFLQMFAGESVTLLAAFLAGYFYALTLGPSDYGVWQTARVFISYSIVFTFSLPFVMRRDFVMLRSEGRFEEALKISNLVFTYELFVTPILSSGLILYSIFFIENYLLRISVIAVGFIYIFQFIGGYSNILAKGLNNYQLIKKASFIYGILTILSIPFVYVWGMEALLIATLVIALSNSVYYYVNRPFNYNIYWSNKLFKSLLLISFPLYLQDISSTIFDTIDRLIIAKYLNYAEVGYYSLSSLVIIPLRLVIASFSIVLFTQLNENHGFAKSETVVEHHVIIPHKILAYTFPPLLGMAVIALPYFVEIFLPQYSKGVISAQIALFATFIFLLNSFSANALFVVNKQGKTAFIYLLIGILKTVLCFFSVYWGFGIIGVAASTAFAYVILDFLMLRVIFRQIGKSVIDLCKHFASEMIPIIIVAIFCWVHFNFIAKYLNYSLQLNPFSIMVVGFLFIMISCAPIAFIGYKRVKVVLASGR